MGEIKISTLAGVWGKLIPNFTYDLEELMSSVEENCRCMDIAGKLEFEARPESGTGLLHTQDETATRGVDS